MVDVVFRKVKLFTLVATMFIAGLVVGLVVAPVIPDLKRAMQTVLETDFARQEVGKAVFGKVEGDVANITSKFRQVSLLAQKFSKVFSFEKLARVAKELPPISTLITPFLGEKPLYPPPITFTTAIAVPIATLRIEFIETQFYTPTYTVFYEQQVEGVDEPDPVKYLEVENLAYVVAENGVVKLVSFKPLSTIVGEINVSRDAEKVAAKLVVVEASNTATRTLVELKPRVRVEALHLVGGSLFAIVQLDYPHIPKTNLTDQVLVLVYNPKTGQLIDWFWVEGRYFDSRAYLDPSTGKARLLLVAVKHTWMLGSSPRTSWGPIPSNATAILSPTPNTITIVVLYDTSTHSKSAVAVAGGTPKLVYFDPHYGLYIVYKAVSLKLLNVAEEILRELCRVVEEGGDVEGVVVRTLKLLLSRLPRETLISPLKTGVVKIDVVEDNLVVKHYRELEGLPVGNQFSIDLYNNTLRIVLGRVGGGFNLYVLDPITLKQLANMTIALPGERVYGVRFIGPYLYIVTYRAVDPLFAISLANPEKPEVLGWRKGPGWDELLYPLNETAVLGIGFNEEHELRVSVYRLEEDGDIKLCSRVVVEGERSSILFQGRYGYHALVVDRKRGWILVPGMLEYVKVAVDGKTQIMAALSYHLIRFDPATLSLGQPEEMSLSFKLDKPPSYRYARALIVDNTIHIITPYKVVDYRLAGGKPVLVAETKLV